MVLQTVGLQLLLTAFSAVAAAGTLLWMQTKYRRVKLLHGLEKEVEHNLHKVGETGNRVYKLENTSAIRGEDFYDDIYRTVMAETPVLYSRLAGGLSAVSMAYQKIAVLQSIGAGYHVADEDREEFLKDLENIEGRLLQAGERIKEIQRDSWAYHLYNRIWLREDLERPMRVFSSIALTNEDSEEIIWRPSGRSEREQEEEYSKAN